MSAISGECELLLPLPFPREEWSGGATIAAVFNDKRFEKYHLDCINQIHKSGRYQGYVDVIIMISHIGRFPAFKKEHYDKFLAEAKSQMMTKEKLETTIELIAQTCGPNEALPTAAIAFEFLTFASDFCEYMAKTLQAGSRVKKRVQDLRTLGMMAFLVALNVEYRLVERHAWNLGKP